MKLGARATFDRTNDPTHPPACAQAPANLGRSMNAHLAPASDELLDRYGPVLADLGASWGISALRHGRPGTLVADVAPGRR